MREDEPWRRREPDPPEINPRIPTPARILNYLLGGTSNFTADRNVIREVFAEARAFDGARRDAAANRAFLARAATHLAGSGIRQFVDIGTGVPGDDMVHDTVQRIVPDARVAYVDNDRVVLAHTHFLTEGTPDGESRYFHGDLRRPRLILKRLPELLDLAEPVALLLAGVLSFLPDDTDPYGVVEYLLDAAAPGSYLVISHFASDVRVDEMATVTKRLNKSLNGTLVPRSSEEVRRFVAGLDVLDPGVVPVDEWRPDRGPPASEGEIAIHGVVARKP